MRCASTRIVGGSAAKPFTGSKAGRAKTSISNVSYAKDDLFRYGTPLHKAAYRGELEVCKELMDLIEKGKHTDDLKPIAGEASLDKESRYVIQYKSECGGSLTLVMRHGCSEGSRFRSLLVWYTGSCCTN